MKHRIVIACILLLLITGAASAAAPRLMSFQGKLTNNSDQALTGNYNFTFRIYGAATGGAAMWTEVQNAVVVETGIYNVLLGSVTALNLAFDTGYWLSVEVNGDGEMSPRYRLTSAPYSLFSDTATNSLSGSSGNSQRIVLTGTFDTSVAGDYQRVISVGGRAKCTRRGRVRTRQSVPRAGYLYTVDAPATTATAGVPDTTSPLLRLLPDTAAFTAATQYFYGTIIDSSGISYLRVSLNGGADSTLMQAGQNYGFNLILRHGENTIVLTAADTAGNTASLTRIVMLADTVIIPTDTQSVTVQNPLAPDTGVVVVKIPTADTFVIAVPVWAANGFRYDDSWIIELNSRDTAVNFIAQAVDPDSVNTGTEQLYRWDEFKYTIFEFSILTDSGNDVSDSSAAYDALWVTFHVSPQMLARLPQSEIAHLNLFWFNENSRKWVPVGGTQVDVNAGTIRAKLNHFSIYAVFSGLGFAAPAANLSNVRVYPNPFRPNDGNSATGTAYRSPGDGSGVYMNGLVPGTEIKIYDLRGRLLDEMTVPAGTGAMQWDVRNKAGEDVASGIYLFHFNNGGEQVIKKLMVIR